MTIEQLTQYVNINGPGEHTVTLLVAKKNKPVISFQDETGGVIWFYDGSDPFIFDNLPYMDEGNVVTFTADFKITNNVLRIDSSTYPRDISIVNQIEIPIHYIYNEADIVHGLYSEFTGDVTYSNNGTITLTVGDTDILVYTDGNIFPDVAVKMSTISVNQTGVTFRAISDPFLAPTGFLVIDVDDVNPEPEVIEGKDFNSILVLKSNKSDKFNLGSIKFIKESTYNDIKDNPNLGNRSVMYLSKVSSGSDSVQEAPTDGKAYGRQDGEWTDLNTLIDDKTSGMLKNTDIIDNLTSTETDKPLSANQGRALNDMKLDKSSVVNNLTSTSTTDPLSAYMGRVLNDNKLDKSSVVDNLTSTSTIDPLSANQGKVLRELVQAKEIGKVYDVIEDMINDLNTADADKYQLSLNLLIKDLDVPDFWISSINATSVTYTYSDDQDVIDNISTNGEIQVGYYTLCIFETKVDLYEYIKKSEVVNNLTSTSTIDPLSANQGKVLDEKKVDKSSVVDNLASTSTTDPLSANQGKYLNDNKVDKTQYVKNSTNFDNIVGFGGDNNTDYSFDTLESIEFATSTYLPGPDYISGVSFTSSTVPTIVTQNNEYFTGDDCSNGIFTPVANKRYNVVIWMDDDVPQGVVRGRSI